MICEEIASFPVGYSILAYAFLSATFLKLLFFNFFHASKLAASCVSVSVRFARNFFNYLFRRKLPRQLLTWLSNQIGINL